jgi:hypothetical protein
VRILLDDGNLRRSWRLLLEDEYGTVWYCLSQSSEAAVGSKF